MKALLFTASFVVVISAGSVLANKDKTTEMIYFGPDHEISTIKIEETLPPLPVSPPPPPLPLQQVKTQQFTKPIIVVDKLATDDVIEELTDDAVIGSKTIESNIIGIIPQLPVEEIKTQVFERPAPAKEDEVLVNVDFESQFPGGSAAWRKYLERGLNAEAPIQNGAPIGTYQVLVQFIVSTDGSISDVKPLTKHGYGMEDEAIKIIKRGPNWKPAIHNGKNVNAYRRQPVTFVVEE